MCGFQEGKQASLAADFSVTQFKHLGRLLMVHGRNSYKRSAALSQFVIHRSLCISTMQVGGGPGWGAGGARSPELDCATAPPSDYPTGHIAAHRLWMGQAILAAGVGAASISRGACPVLGRKEVWCHCPELFRLVCQREMCRVKCWANPRVLTFPNAQMRASRE